MPSFFTVRISGSSRTRSGCVVVSGRSTSMPCCIIGAVTMKMISSTSITSTNGVTLISENGAVLARRSGAATASPRPRAPPARPARSSRAEVRLELAREEVDRACELAQARDEDVVEDRRGDRGEEADRRRDQRLGDAGRDHREARAARRRRCSSKALMMPITVPNRPMNGVALPVVARKPSRRSSRSASSRRRPVDAAARRARAALRRAAHRDARRAYFAKRSSSPCAARKTAESGLAVEIVRGLVARPRASPRGRPRETPRYPARRARSSRHLNTITAHDKIENAASSEEDELDDP